MPSLSMVYEILARDLATPTFRKLGAEIEATAVKSEAATERLGRSLKAIGAASTVALGFVAVESIKAAATFETSMARVQIAAGVPAKDIKALGDELLNLSPKVGVGPDQLAESLYHVESAGFRGRAAIEQVTAAAKLSRMGATDINLTSQAIIATMASGVKGVRDANDAASLILKTVGTGDTTILKVTEALGTGILSTVAAVGLSFKDFGAALATLTDNAIPADVAANKLRTSFLIMETPTKKAMAALAGIGMSSTQLAEDMRKPNGLQVALDDLRGHLDKTFPANGGVQLSIAGQRAAVQTYTDTLKASGVSGKELTDLTDKYAKSIASTGSNAVLATQQFSNIFGGSKTAGTMLTLYEQESRMTDKLGQFGTVASRAAEMQAAWAKQQDTFKQKLADLGSAVDVMKIKVGNVLLPAVKGLVDFISGHMGVFQAFSVMLGTTMAAAALAFLGPFALIAGAVAGVALAVYKLSDPFVHWGKAVHDAVGIAKKDWGSFTDGFKNPFETINVTGTSAMFERWGQTVGKAIQGAKLDWNNFRAGFAHPDGDYDTGIVGRGAKFADFGIRVHKAFTDITDAAKTVWHWFQDNMLPVFDKAWHLFQDDVLPVLVKVAKAIGKDLVDAAPRHLEDVAGPQAGLARHRHAVRRDRCRRPQAAADHRPGAQGRVRHRNHGHRRHALGHRRPHPRRRQLRGHGAPRRGDRDGRVQGVRQLPVRRDARRHARDGVVCRSTRLRVRRPHCPHLQAGRRLEGVR